MAVCRHSHFIKNIAIQNVAFTNPAIQALLSIVLILSIIVINKQRPIPRPIYNPHDASLTQSVQTSPSMASAWQKTWSNKFLEQFGLGYFSKQFVNSIEASSQNGTGKTPEDLLIHFVARCWWWKRLCSNKIYAQPTNYDIRKIYTKLVTDM